MLPAQLLSHGTEMANAVVASWTACISALQHLLVQVSHTTSAALSGATQSVVQLVEKLGRQPPLPHAAWKRLAQDVQVTWLARGVCLAGG
jgi:hypothetical protein